MNNFQFRPDNIDAPNQSAQGTAKALGMTHETLDIDAEAFAEMDRLTAERDQKRDWTLARETRVLKLRAAHDFHLRVGCGCLG